MMIMSGTTALNIFRSMEKSDTVQKLRIHQSYLTNLN